MIVFRAICLFSGDMIQSPIYDGEPKRKVVEAGWCLILLEETQTEQTHPC
jgi:hypothetical protein